MRKQKGSMMQLMATGLCVLALTVVMMAYLRCASLIQQKTQVSQLARRYILQMETVGYLTPAQHTALVQELELIGVTDIDLTGTTIGQVEYGMMITLRIAGELEGIAFEEKRVSTAKN